MSLHLRLEVRVHIDVVDEHGATVNGVTIDGVTLETDGHFDDLPEATAALEALAVNVEEEQDDARAYIARELDAAASRDERKKDQAHRRMWAINSAMRWRRRTKDT